MLYFILIFICVGIVYLLSRIKSQNENAKYDTNINDSAHIDDPVALNRAESELDTAQIVQQALTEIGCQPQKDDDSIMVAYQGEKFVININGSYAHIWDLGWSVIKANDPDLPQIRESVNYTNFHSEVTIVLSSPDKEGNIWFHSRQSILLHPSCTVNTHFIQTTLNAFFQAKELAFNHYHQANAQQTEPQKKRRPVGFTAPGSEEEQA